MKSQIYYLLLDLMIIRFFIGELPAGRKASYIMKILESPVGFQHTVPPTPSGATFFGSYRYIM